MSSLRPRTIASVMAAAALLVGAVGASAFARTTHHAAFNPNATITLATNADPTFMQWSPSAYAESDTINEMIFSGLTKWSVQSAPQPDLATSWTTSANGLTWTFQLRKGVTWQDGKPFSSADVAFTFNDIVLNAKLGAQGSSNFSDVTNVTTDGPNAVQFHLKAPWASLPAYLAYYAPILPQHLLAGVKDPWTYTAFDQVHPVGTGPFELLKYVPGQYVELTRNPHYFGGAAKVKNIVFQIIPDANTQTSDLLSGALSMLTVQDAQLLAHIKTDPNIVVKTVTQNTWYWVGLNQNDPMFTNVRVRQALEYALNRPAMIKAILQGYGTVANGPIAPIQKTFFDAKVASYPYNPKMALKLLAQAGWTRNAKGALVDSAGKQMVIDMPTGQYGYLVPATELVQQYWQALGIKVNLQVEPWNNWIQQVVVKRNYQATVAWWSTPTDPDMYPYFASSAANVGYNIPNYKNPTLDRLFLQARSVTATAPRAAIYARIQSLIAQQLPYNFLWYPQDILAIQGNVHGVPNANIAVAADHVTQWYVSP